MYKLIIAGGRNFSNEYLLFTEVTKFLKDFDIKEQNLEVVSGMAKGADSLGYQLALHNKIDTSKFYADWKDMSEPCVVKQNSHGTYNALAGMKRNHKMGEYANGLIAFWDGKSRGTKDMIEFMRTLNKDVRVITY